MTQEQKIDYFRIAASICGFRFTEEAIEMLVETYELVLRKEGQSDLHDMIEIEFKVKEKYKQLELQKLAEKRESSTKKD